jgi:hypothetical protein
VPVAEITENTNIKAGTITKIQLTFGDNNHLGVNNEGVDCYKLAKKEITLDMNAVLMAEALNEIVVSIDICGNFSAEPRYQQKPCYTLNQVMAFQSFTVR